jgi:hypothetical protein
MNDMDPVAADDPRPYLAAAFPGDGPNPIREPDDEDDLPDDEDDEDDDEDE